MAFQINGEKGRSIVSVSGRPSLFFLLRGSHFPFSHRAQNVFLTLSNTAHFSKCACSLVSIACKILFYLGESVGQTKFLPAVSTVCHGSVYKRFSPASPADTAMRTEWSNRKISFCATGHATSLVGRCAWNGSSRAVLFRLQSKPLVNRWYAQTRKGLITGFAPQWTSNKPYAHSQLLSFRISYILM